MGFLFMNRAYSALTQGEDLQNLWFRGDSQELFCLFVKDRAMRQSRTSHVDTLLFPDIFG